MFFILAKFNLFETRVVWTLASSRRFLQRADTSPTFLETDFFFSNVASVGTKTFSLAACNDLEMTNSENRAGTYCRCDITSQAALWLVLTTSDASWRLEDKHRAKTVECMCTRCVSIWKISGRHSELWGLGLNLQEKYLKHGHRRVRQFICHWKHRVQQPPESIRTQVHVHTGWQSAGPWSTQSHVSLVKEGNWRLDGSTRIRKGHVWQWSWIFQSLHQYFLWLWSFFFICWCYESLVEVRQLSHQPSQNPPQDEHTLPDGLVWTNESVWPWPLTGILCHPLRRSLTGPFSMYTDPDISKYCCEQMNHRFMF